MFMSSTDRPTARRGSVASPVFSAVLLSNNLGTFLAALMGNRVQRQLFARPFIRVTGLRAIYRELCSMN